VIRFVSLQEKRNNFFVYAPIFVLKRGKFAHVPGASAGHLGLTQQKRKLPEIFKGADATEFKCMDICTLRVFFLPRRASAGATGGDLSLLLFPRTGPSAVGGSDN
jgi:hypothetical protein